MHQDLIIHREVRDWVFIPLTLLIIMMNMLRQYAHIVCRSHPTVHCSILPAGCLQKCVRAVHEQQRPELRAACERRERAPGCPALSSCAYDVRNAPIRLVREKKGIFRRQGVLTCSASQPCLHSMPFTVPHVQTGGVLVQEMAATNMQAKMMSDPSMMTNMLKSQLTGTAPHLLMGFLVNHFFSGFIMGKIPFTLTPRFRQMMQRGIDMPSLDVSYFTSLSYYILLLFGLRGILQLIFSGDVIDESAVMTQSMKGANPAFDAKQEYKIEAQRYDLVRSYSTLICVSQVAIRHAWTA